MITTVSKQPRNDRHQILALSGGGYRGLYSIGFLERCERRYGVKCKDKFDLFAGTSIGALLAAGLAVGMEAKTLVESIKMLGSSVFPKSDSLWVKRLFVKSPYKIERLETAIREVLSDEVADTPLQSLEAPLIIPTVNYTTGKTSILRSLGATGNVLQSSNLTLLQAILASTAAPTYFSTYKLDNGTDEFIDGGLVANSPDLIAFNHVHFRKKIPLKEIYMVSVGTAGRKFGATVRSNPLKPSILSWLLFRRLIQTTMSVQEDLILREISSILGDQHFRIDCEPKRNQESVISEIDKADEKATATLESLASESFETIHAEPRFRAFFRDFSDDWLRKMQEQQ